MHLVATLTGTFKQDTRLGVLHTRNARPLPVVAVDWVRTLRCLPFMEDRRADEL
jgi:hypothetical protein